MEQWIVGWLFCCLFQQHKSLISFFSSVSLASLKMVMRSDCFWLVQLFNFNCSIAVTHKSTCFLDFFNVYTSSAWVSRWGGTFARSHEIRSSINSFHGKSFQSLAYKLVSDLLVGTVVNLQMSSVWYINLQQVV